MDVSVTTSPEPDLERRNSGSRARARDRLMDRASSSAVPQAVLASVENIGNLMLFLDDDLREAALAITQLEQYLVRALGVLESSDLSRRDVQGVASDVDVLDQLDHLNETLESLRRRLAKLASQMR